MVPIVKRFIRFMFLGGLVAWGTLRVPFTLSLAHFLVSMVNM